MDQVEKCLCCQNTDCSNCMSGHRAGNVGGRPSLYDTERMRRYMLLGLSLQAIAERNAVSERTAYRWARRYLAESVSSAK